MPIDVLARIDALEQEAERLDVLGKRFSSARLVLFITTIVLVIQGLNGYELTLFPAIFTGIGFIIVVFIDQNTSNKLKLSTQKLAIQKDELLRKKGELVKVNDGSEYLDFEHPFAQDLDIFGRNSLFYHINRCSLSSSETRLAAFLTSIKDRQTVLDRQEALTELKPLSDWREDVQGVLGSLSFEERKVDQVLLATDVFEKKPSIGVLIFNFLLSTITLSLAVLTAISAIPPGYFILNLIFNFIVLGRYNLQLQKIVVRSDRLFRFLSVFSRSIQKIQEQSFTNIILKGNQEKLQKEAGRELWKLQQIVYLLDTRANFLWPLANMVLVVDLYTGWLLKSWLARNKESLKDWLQALNEFEVYISLAGCYDLREDLSFPNVLEEDGVWEGSAIRHPLLFPEPGVPNDFQLTRPLNLVTGSNMSGKSTFLRTVGLNSLMAWVGLPVAAENVNISRFKLFSSMRTRDDLSSGASSFYAELRRIQLLFEEMDSSNEQVLFFIDEIFKGTNAMDRQVGVRGVVKRLLETSARGFISTHDLELADEYAENELIRNLSFNSTIAEEDQLIFDYKLTEGKCHSTNAVLLMKRMGIIE